MFKVGILVGRVNSTDWIHVRTSDILPLGLYPFCFRLWRNRPAKEPPPTFRTGL